MSKQDELDELKLKQDHAKASIHGMECGCLKRNLDIIALEAEIAEEAKPKPEHLDYGFFPKFNAIGVYLNFGPFKDTISYKSKVNNCDHATCVVAEGFDEGFVKYGNYNDLTATQEDVTEFEIESDYKAALDERKNTLSCDFTVEPSGMVGFCIDGSDKTNHIWLKGNGLSVLILKLRQMQATLNRKKGSE